MTPRLILILAFLLPQVWLPATAAATMSPDCRMACCKVVVQPVVTCCGEVEYRPVPADRMDVCTCRADTAPSDQPVPPPMPRSSTRIDLPILAPVWMQPLQTRPIRPAAASYPDGYTRAQTHNAVQARVGVWLI